MAEIKDNTEHEASNLGCELRTDISEIQNISEWDSYDSNPDIKKHLIEGAPFYETRQSVNNVLECLEQKNPGAYTVPRLLTKDEIDKLPIGSVVTLKAGETVIEILDNISEQNTSHTLLILTLKNIMGNN